MTSDKQQAINNLKSLGFEIENKTIFLSDDLPMLNPMAQSAIGFLCEEYGYECNADAMI